MLLILLNLKEFQVSTTLLLSELVLIPRHNLRSIKSSVNNSDSDVFIPTTYEVCRGILFWGPSVCQSICNIFISAQYCGKTLMDFDQILHLHWYWWHQTWDCLSSRQFIAELWPLNDVRILFSLNILETNEWILTTFCIGIDFDNVYLGIVKYPIHCRVTALHWCRYFVST